uniref:Sacsin/Nov domain-containing protein n=1 Tax=Vitis vinifera TaxID=29760 RepID=A5C914_VITVI|nr:hypothetical protein VITISV_043379 [Vitis vinifera]
MNLSLPGATEAFGHHEALTIRLKHILKMYTDGPGILFGLVKNAEDVGALEVIFLLEKTQYGTSTIISPEMADCPQDLYAISQIGQENKLEKPFAIGRFGLGFNYVYHPTDIPTFVSEENISIEDLRDDRFAEFNKDGKQLDSDVHLKHVRDGHVAAYVVILMKDNSLSIEGYHTFRGGFWNYFSMGMDARASYAFHKDHCKEMGGCCCCSSKGTELNGTPAYYYCPRAPEEQELLSSHHGAASTLFTGLLVDTNLGTSPSNTYRPPPAPIPYDVDLGHPQTLPATEESCVNKNVTAELVASSIYVGQFA